MTITILDEVLRRHCPVHLIDRAADELARLRALVGELTGALTTVHDQLIARDGRTPAYLSAVLARARKELAP